MRPSKVPANGVLTPAGLDSKQSCQLGFLSPDAQAVLRGLVSLAWSRLWGWLAGRLAGWLAGWQQLCVQFPPRVPAHSPPALPWQSATEGSTAVARALGSTPHPCLPGWQCRPRGFECCSSERTSVHCRRSRLLASSWPPLHTLMAQQTGSIHFHTPLWAGPLRGPAPLKKHPQPAVSFRAAESAPD